MDRVSPYWGEPPGRGTTRERGLREGAHRRRRRVRAGGGDLHRRGHRPDRRLAAPPALPTARGSRPLRRGSLARHVQPPGWGAVLADAMGPQNSDRASIEPIWPGPRASSDRTGGRHAHGDHPADRDHPTRRALAARPHDREPRAPPPARDVRPSTTHQQCRRVLWAQVLRRWSGWRSALIVLEPATVVRWQRAGWRRYWTWKSRGRRPGRSRIPAEAHDLILRLARENPHWGPFGSAESSGPSATTSARRPSVATACRRAAARRRSAGGRSSPITGMQSGRRTSLTVPTLTWGTLHVFFVISHARRRSNMSTSPPIRPPPGSGSK